MSKQSRLWCYTLNNPETPDFPDFEDKVVFAKHGEEIAPTTNTPHLQGVLYLKKKITLKGLLKTNWFSGAHWTQCRGNLEENIEYVSKEGYTHEFGQVPENPGDIGGKKEKNRWKEIIAFASDPIFDVHALAEAHPSAAVLHLDKIKKLRIDLTAPPAPPRAQLINYWIWGPTGTGKSTLAKSYGDWYKKNRTDKWFSEPFAYQEVLIYDEVTPNSLDFGTISTVTDHDPFVPECKGGYYRPYRPRIVVFTSNYRLDQCFHHDDLAALQRRIRIVHLPFPAPAQLQRQIAQV